MCNQSAFRIEKLSSGLEENHILLIYACLIVEMEEKKTQTETFSKVKCFSYQNIFKVYAHVSHWFFYILSILS